LNLVGYLKFDLIWMNLVMQNGLKLVFCSETFKLKLKLIFFVDCTMTNIQNFFCIKSLGFVPESKIWKT
jgi:hypothetical protein